MEQRKRTESTVRLLISLASLSNALVLVYRKTERKVEVVIGIQSVCSVLRLGPSTEFARSSRRPSVKCWHHVPGKS